MMLFIYLFILILWFLMLFFFFFFFTIPRNLRYRIVLNFVFRGVSNKEVEK